MPLIGTAGHVDHGKSTLVERITGKHPDRWAEERERGLTIDLGFAWTTLPDGTEVSFVDVPGHERFVKNMLAGVEAIDVALFVVAANEGWMPQSEEHLAVLDLLGVGRGVVALTKVDVVDDDLRALATLEIEDRLGGTSLDGAPVVPVSAVTGEGIEQLLTALASAVPSDPPDDGRPRLWVDRSFSAPGAGTIVTGSLHGGSLATEDTVEIHPGGRRARLRGIQTHERDTDSVAPGRRVALNLAGVSADEVRRGDMVGLPGQWRSTRRFVATLTTARFVDELDQRGAYQLHIGSAAHQVTITGIEAGRAVLTLHDEIPAAVGDRYILRDTGRHLVVAGGRVLDPAPGRTMRALASVSGIDPDADPDDIATRLLAIRSRERVDRLAAHSGGGQARDALVVGDHVLDRALVENLLDRAGVIVDDEHARHPLRAGVPLATLAERLDVEIPIAEALADLGAGLVRRGPSVARPEHDTALTDQQEEAWQRAVALLRKGLDVPSESELGLDGDLMGLKLRSGELVRVAPGLVYLADQIEELKGAMIRCDPEFTVADFRDAAGLSRKYAVPILEWSDKEGLTVRRGDLRSFR